MTYWYPFHIKLPKIYDISQDDLLVAGVAREWVSIQREFIERAGVRQATDVSKAENQMTLTMTITMTTIYKLFTVQ